MSDDDLDPTRWVWRGVAAFLLVLGWVFIAWQNHFHITAPVVFVGLGYLAVIALLFNLWRTGAAAVAADDVGGAWDKPIGKRGELEKEKKTLLKAIKEAEFDREMGKLSKADADGLIQTYRARAIEVIKEIDRLDAGEGDGVRAQIEREVKARIELKAGAKKKPAKAKKPENSGKSDKADKADKASKAEDANPEAVEVPAEPAEPEGHDSTEASS